MALKTRIRLLAATRISIVDFTSLIVMAAFSAAFASDTTNIMLSQVGVLWQVIICLIGVLDLLLSGILLWIVGNQKEAFQRIGKLEKDEGIRDAVCDERHPKK